MSLKKKVSKLAQGVRQVKSQQDTRTQPAAAKPQTLPGTSPAAISVKVSGPVGKPVQTSPARKSDPSAGNSDRLAVWPD